MVLITDLANLELGIVCMLGSFGVTLIVLLTIMIFIQYRKGTVPPSKESKSKMKKLSTSVSKLSSMKTTFHFRNIAFTLDEREDSRVYYGVMFRDKDDKLALKIVDIKIGGRSKSIKPHMSELKEIFFRIQLNNNVTNSIIMSDIYNFCSSLHVDEMFLFSLKDFQLESTSIVIEVFATLTNNKNELMLGWVEIKLPNNLDKYPIEGHPVLQEFERPMDLYLRPIGYACICLANLNDKIKITLLASNNSNNEWGAEEMSNAAFVFHLQIKSEVDKSFVNVCKTAIRAVTTTIVWNEVFFFDIPNKLKPSGYLNIELWKTSLRVPQTSDPPRLIGKINLGLSDKFPQKSQWHWKYVLEKDNEENCRWHPIRSLD